MMDVSDGLVLDASRLAAASGVTIDLDASAPRARIASAALTGGEDHALLATFPPGSHLPRRIPRDRPRRRAVGSIRCSSTARSTTAAAAGTPTATGTHTAGSRYSAATRTHHSTVSPYFLVAGVREARRAASARESATPRSMITVASGGKRRDEQRQRVGQLSFGEVVRRVEEHQVVRTPRTAQERRHRSAVHADRGIRPDRLRDLRGVALDDGGGARRLLDEIDGCRAAADRFEPERARPGVEVQDGRSAQRIGRLQRAEQRFAHAIARRPGSGIGDLEGDRAGPPADDPCHTITIAAPAIPTPTPT